MPPVSTLHSVPQRYSYSQLNTFKSCPEQFKLIYLDRIRKKHESIEAFMGKRVHEVLEWVYDKRLDCFTTFDKLQEKFDELWLDKWHEHIYIANHKVTTDYLYTIGLRCLGNYCSRYGPQFKGNVEGVELPLEFKLGDHTFRGIIDRLDQDSPGNFTIHDYKTGKRAKGEKAALNDTQLALYHLAVGDNFGPVESITVVWHFLRHGKEVRVNLTKTALNKITKRVFRQINKVEEAVKNSGPFIPKESILCHWCYLWSECSAKSGRNPAWQAE